MKNYWLMKSEPEVYSIEDLKRDKTTYWDGVRNYQARNFLRDKMKKGDLAFFYHSNAEPSGIAGIAEIVKEGYPDPSAFERKDIHYDPKCKKENPVWFVVELRFVEKFKRVISLQELRKMPALRNMVLLRSGRLSVQPVSPEEWKEILRLCEIIT
ncbi:MAG TPA: EVE domain-containing protein [bacterium]|nr:EVE domain-containing protein [bacterium]